MHKEELLTLHESFVKAKNLLVESDPEVADEDFDEYHEFGVGPDDTHRPKDDHETAIFLLQMHLADAISSEDIGDVASIGNRMEEFAKSAE